MKYLIFYGKLSDSEKIVRDLHLGEGLTDLESSDGFHKAVGEAFELGKIEESLLNIRPFTFIFFLNT